LTDMSFCFLGRGPFSKSLLLRALIVQSYFPELRIEGDSGCDDVVSMKKGLSDMEEGDSGCDDVVSMKKGLSDMAGLTEINCRHGGAVLRFLALRVSRETGHFIFKGSTRLFQRPLQELQTILSQLSCETKITENGLALKSRGWNLSGDALTLSARRSSQFASAVFLNSWNLNRDLFINIEGGIVSFSYLQMTLSLLRSLGMRITGEGGEYCIPAGQKINRLTYHPESDMSCLFSLAALTVAGGEVVFTDWPEESLQPDFIFPSILENMGFQINKTRGTLKITKGKKLKPVEYNIGNCPDLFPVLSVLCALAEGASYLHGAPHLRYKESNRIERVSKLLEQAGRKVKTLKDGIVIEGQPVSRKEAAGKSVIRFDPQEDHRMVLAAAVLKKAGLPIRILNPEVVKKSFPDFRSVTNIY